MDPKSKSKQRTWWARLGDKIWKSVVALATAFAFITATGQNIEGPILILILSATVALAIYWHLIESITTYFTELKEDIKIIKETVTKRGRSR